MEPRPNCSITPSIIFRNAVLLQKINQKLSIFYLFEQIWKLFAVLFFLPVLSCVQNLVSFWVCLDFQNEVKRCVRKRKKRRKWANSIESSPCDDLLSWSFCWTQSRIISWTASIIKMHKYTYVVFIIVSIWKGNLL